MDSRSTTTVAATARIPPSQSTADLIHLLHSVTAGLISYPRSSPTPTLPEPRACCSSSPLSLPFLKFHRQSPKSRSPSKSTSFRGMSATVKADGLNSSSVFGRGPAFFGQVFTMINSSGEGILATHTPFGIPFISQRIPHWMKKMISFFNRSENRAQIVRFFTDLNDAVTYVKQFDATIGKVGACRLEMAYEYFKENPDKCQFVPNSKQVKAANKILKESQCKCGTTKLDGVPVFSAQNLCIAVATDNGIKWYTPYFFDKNLLDDIVEASVDQHFHALIQNRRGKRRKDVFDDGFAAETVEENWENLFEPPEVQEVLDEMGHPSIPLSVISKVVEIQLLDVVDSVLLGNKWLRKATGIQPKFPYLVDTLEARSASSFLKATEALSSIADSNIVENGNSNIQVGVSDLELNKHAKTINNHQEKRDGFHFPLKDWMPNPWLKQPAKQQGHNNSIESKRSTAVNKECTHKPPLSAFFPIITLVCIANSETGKRSRASLKKKMGSLTRELLETSHTANQLSEDKDPLFIANVGDYSAITRVRSA